MAAQKVPTSLESGGRALWESLAYDGMPEYQVALLIEACRTRDRLDKLDRYLTGQDEWLRLVETIPTSHCVVVDNALSRANAAAATLRSLLAELPAPAVEVPKPATQRQAKGTPLDELRAKREAGPRAGASRPSGSRRRS